MGRKLKNGLSIRGDSYYCPLSFQLDTYWSCKINCRHCYMRHLNRTWGWDLRPLDFDVFRTKILNAEKNTKPKSPLAWALHLKKTIRFGNKTDPYQPAEREHKISRRVLRFLKRYHWSTVIQTKCTQLLFERDTEIVEGSEGDISVMPIISPGLEVDWDIFERQRTTPPEDRLKHCQHWVRKGVNVGVNGEPFIPGFHTVKQFENAVKAVKAAGVRSYNTYHLHFNDLVAKNFHAVGLDIEKIWHMNQDENWKPILQQLIDIAKKHDIILGCPDFVNSGQYTESANTCCGINVPNPCTFNMIYWKKMYLKGETDPDVISRRTWDGIGDREEGEKLIRGENSSFYGFKDIGL